MISLMILDYSPKYYDSIIVNKYVEGFYCREMMVYQLPLLFYVVCTVHFLSFRVFKNQQNTLIELQ